ncbi:MAG: hypothetical protein U0132_01140 [Gemmatimonadaceae bacterium]
MAIRQLIGAGVWLVLTAGACTHPAQRLERGTDDRLVVSPTSDPKVRDDDIAFYERRLTEDPQSAMDRSRLALLLLARARETGSVTDIDRAEHLCQESLQLRESHNAGTYSILASARLAKHDFIGARTAAERLVDSDPESPTARALLGEVQLELGNYQAASEIFTQLESHTSELSVASRLVRWYELTGHLDRARTLARYVARRALDEGNLSREQVAWFQMRAGDLAVKRGDLSAADTAYQTGLSIFPDDYRILAAQARVAAARHDWRSAIAKGEAATAIQLDPATLGLLADAWRALGDSAQGASYEKAMTTSALTQPGAIHRAWGLYLLDHRRRVDEVLVRLRRELRTRHDVYGYDLLAWGLHRQGDDRQAWQAMQRALAQGTEDAQLAYHAAVIARTLGKATDAAQQVRQMAAWNPSYQGPLNLAAGPGDTGSR